MKEGLMRKHIVLGLATLGAIALLATMIVGTAAARRIRWDENHFSIIWNRASFPETTLMGFSFEAIGVPPVNCPVTLEGSLHSAAVSKVSGALIGYITSAQVGQAVLCEGGTATALTETLPWHIRYDSFTGTLPNITGVEWQIIGLSFRFQPAREANACLIRTSAARPAKGTFIGARLELFRWNGAARIPGMSQPTCPFAGDEGLAGTGAFRRPGNGTTKINVSLVP
jgi:hypothetical protein